ncbi:hypothetical protein Tco_1195155 [Tanacetum coccineum]
MPTEMELTLEQTQQGVSYEVSFDESNTHVLERFYTSAGNPVKEILLKLNLPDHRKLKDGGEDGYELGFGELGSRLTVFFAFGFGISMKMDSSSSGDGTCAELDKLVADSLVVGMVGLDKWLLDCFDGFG